MEAERSRKSMGTKNCPRSHGPFDLIAFADLPDRSTRPSSSVSGSNLRAVEKTQTAVAVAPEPPLKRNQGRVQNPYSCKTRLKNLVIASVQRRFERRSLSVETRPQFQ